MPYLQPARQHKSETISLALVGRSNAIQPEGSDPIAMSRVVSLNSLHARYDTCDTIGVIGFISFALSLMISGIDQHDHHIVTNNHFDPIAGFILTTLFSCSPFFGQCVFKQFNESSNQQGGDKSSLN